MATQADKDAFAAKLRALMDARKIGNSDLARILFGDRLDKKGHRGAKNRDIVGSWVNAQSFPTRQWAMKLAELFAVPLAELAPRYAASQALMMPKQTAFSIHTPTETTGRPDIVRLHVDALVKISALAHILPDLTRIIQEGEKEAADADNNPDAPKE